jgi:hypothetical protein
MVDSAAPSGKSRRLSDVVREVKIATAEREDVVVDMKEADKARLELLAEELAPIFKEVPAEEEQFDFVISSGLQPRLWIDAVAHVQMGPDRRTYRFVLDTRHGRVVMAETGNLMRVADSVCHYVAERLIERQRFLASDQTPPDFYGAPMRQRQSRAEPDGPPATVQAGNATVPVTRPVAHEPGALSRRTAILWFLLGAAFGAAALFIAFREQLGPALGGI